MIAGLMWVFFSYWGIGGVALLLIAAGVAVIFFLQWRTLGLLLIAAAVAHIYSGSIYQSGIKACETYTAVQVEKTRNEWVKVVSDLRVELATAKANDQKDVDALPDLAARLATKPERCKIQQEDIDEIER